MSGKDQIKKIKEGVDVVSQDKDWRGVIENELRAQENWQKEWGFLAENTTGMEKPLTKLDKIRNLEEKLKSMENVKIESEFKNKFRGNAVDIKVSSYNKRKEGELLPQSRRPKAISLAHAKLVEAIGENYENEPYQNYLGSK